MGTDNIRLPLQLYAVSHRPYAIGSAASEKATDRRWPASQETCPSPSSFARTGWAGRTGVNPH